MQLGSNQRFCKQVTARMILSVSQLNLQSFARPCITDVMLGRGHKSTDVMKQESDNLVIPDLVRIWWQEQTSI